MRIGKGNPPLVTTHELVSLAGERTAESQSPKTPDELAAGYRIQCASEVASADEGKVCLARGCHRPSARASGEASLPALSVARCDKLQVWPHLPKHHQIPVCGPSTCHLQSSRIPQGA